MKEEKIVMFDSDEAASEQTVTKRVSRHGLICQDERMARFNGCTHVKCDRCDNIVEKTYTVCDECRAKKSQQVFNDTPVVEWDHKTPLVLFGTDQYFWDENEVRDYAEEEECDISKLELMVCAPRYISEVDSYCHCEDDLAEDGEVPSEVEAAFDVLNKVIRDHKKPASWIQGKARVLLK